MAKDSIDKATDRQIAEIDKELNEMYARAALEIREKSEDFAREFEKKDAKKRKLVEEGKLDKAEYERWRNTQIFQSENYKQLEKNIAAEMANTNQTAIDYVNGELPKTYAHAYNGFGAGIASVAVGYDFALLNNDSLIALSEVEAKKLNVPKDTAWTNKKIRAEVAQGIAQGESTTAIAKRFEKIGVSEGAAAKRLARTMIGGAQNGGKQAAMQRASASGIIMGKQWKAFHDARTRDSHIMLDNEIVAVDDAFSNGCRYPRDPEGAPGEICNCRCTMSGKVMGFRHADGSVTMVDMSVNCTEMPEGVFPPGYTYSQWKQDAQNRITAKQLREEELAAAENPGYGNSLLQKGRKHGIIASNKQHFKRDIEKEQAIEKAIKSDKPAFEEDLYKNYKSDKIPSGYYGVALHGSQYSAKVYDVPIDCRTLVNIINARGDYNGEPVYLISCNTGKVNEKGKCFAQELSNILGVEVKAPNTYAAINAYGDVFLSTKRGIKVAGDFTSFTPK